MKSLGSYDPPPAAGVAVSVVELPRPVGLPLPEPDDDHRQFLSSFCWTRVVPVDHAQPASRGLQVVRPQVPVAELLVTRNPEQGLQPQEVGDGGCELTRERGPSFFQGVGCRVPVLRIDRVCVPGVYPARGPDWFPVQQRQQAAHSVKLPPGSTSRRSTHSLTRTVAPPICARAVPMIVCSGRGAGTPRSIIPAGELVTGRRFPLTKGMPYLFDGVVAPIGTQPPDGSHQATGCLSGIRHGMTQTELPRHPATVHTGNRPAGGSGSTTSTCRRLCTAPEPSVTTTPTHRRPEHRYPMQAVNGSGSPPRCRPVVMFPRR